MRERRKHQTAPVRLPALDGATRTVVIGIGNEYRSDDAVGLWTARHVRDRLPGNCLAVEQTGEGTALMESWQDTARVVVIDAVAGASIPGSVYRFDARYHTLPQGFFGYSTHDFGLAEAIELARALNQLPHRLVVYGIAGKSFEPGIGLSPEVEHAARGVVERVLHDVESDGS